MKEFMNLNRNIKLRLLTLLITDLTGYAITGNLIIYYIYYFDKFTAGILLMVASISNFLANLYGGHFSDEKGRKEAMKVGLTFMVLGDLLSAAFNSPFGNFPRLAFLMFLLEGAGFNFAIPAFEAVIIDITTLKNRDFVYSLVYWIQNISIMFGAAIGAWLFRDYLFQLLLITIIGSTIVWILAVIMMDETKLSFEKSANIRVLDVVKSYKEALKDKRYVLFIIGGICSTVIFMQPDYSLATHLIQDFKTISTFGIEIYGQRMFSIVVIVNAASIVLLVFLFKQLTKNWSLLKRYVLGAFFHGLGFILAMLTNKMFPIIIFAILFTIGEMINIPASQSIRAQLMNPKKIGVYSGVFSAVMPIGQLVASMIVSGSAFFGNIGVVVFLLFFTISRCYLTIKAIKMPSPF
ncbi:MAG: MFS transporter [Streptococcaceae bacterium]|jgi:DHA1 family multidrug resistance protein B-like MFS transporter|nr:MFS transporter [Streptococcaceae bacterium]